MSWKLLFLVLTVFATAASGAFGVDTWTVFELPEWEEQGSLYNNISFMLDGNNLSMNAASVNSAGGSSTQSWDLLFSGKWAVAGSIDDSGNLLADPYARFVYAGNGGYLEWSQDTPQGYIAPLLLGYSFSGDGGQSYTGNIGDEQSVVSGTLVVWSHLPMRPDEYNRYESTNHTFYAAYNVGAANPVPEPSSIMALLCGLSGLSGYVIRKRRQTAAISSSASTST